MAKLSFSFFVDMDETNMCWVDSREVNVHKSCFDNICEHFGSYSNIVLVSILIGLFSKDDGFMSW